MSKEEIKREIEYLRDKQAKYGWRDGLKQQEESIRVDYALYRKISDKNPLIRFETLKEAKDEYLNSKDYIMIVCEVSELKNGKRIITQERVIKAPEIWLPADRFIPEFDDYYLCHIERDEECGNLKKHQTVLMFEKGNWKTVIREKVTHWKIVENPVFQKGLAKKIKTDKGSTTDEFST